MLIGLKVVRLSGLYQKVIEKEVYEKNRSFHHPGCSQYFINHFML